MNILYIGDVMATMGIRSVEQVLPELIKSKNIDFVIAQAENVTQGKGMSLADYEHLKSLGVDAFSGGNHTPQRPELHPLLEDASEPVVGPANMPSCPGPGYKYVHKSGKTVLVISLLGGVVGRSADLPTDNPLGTIDHILRQEIDTERDACVVNFHGDYSSEKVIIGHYLDGRVTAVIGDHWHTPTADAQVLPHGTAHVTDVGMCGSLDSSLGVTFDAVIPRWRDGIQTKNALETSGRSQFNALLVEVDDTSGKAISAEHIRKIW